MLYKINSVKSKNSYMELESINIKNLGESGEVIEIKTPYELIAFMEEKVINGDAFNYDVVKMLKDDLQLIKQNHVRKYDDYKNISYYIDKLRWISKINIENYSEDCCQREIETIKKGGNSGFAIPMLELSIRKYIEELQELYKEQISDLLNDQIGTMYCSKHKKSVDHKFGHLEIIPPHNLKSKAK